MTIFSLVTKPQLTLGYRAAVNLCRSAAKLGIPTQNEITFFIGQEARASKIQYPSWSLDTSEESALACGTGWIETGVVLPAGRRYKLGSLTTRKMLK